MLNERGEGSSSDSVFVHVRVSLSSWQSQPKGGTPNVFLRVTEVERDPCSGECRFVVCHVATIYNLSECSFWCFYTNCSSVCFGWCLKWTMKDCLQVFTWAATLHHFLLLQHISSWRSDFSSLSLSLSFQGLTKHVLTRSTSTVSWKYRCPSSNFKARFPHEHSCSHIIAVCGHNWKRDC